MADTTYDVAIIGSGPAGYTAAIRAGQLGLKAALIEKDPYLGGTCLHVGCIPTKSLLFNAEVFDHVKDGDALGIENITAPKLNWGTIQKRKQGIVDKHAKGLQFLMKKNKVTVIEGWGKLTGPAKNGILTVDVEGKSGKSSITAKNVILSTGSVARVLPGLKPDDRILTNIEVLSLNDIPKSLIVIGSGAVGVEFASIYKSFGADVTILEMLPRYVPVEDEDISKELARVYRKRGINGFVNAKVEKVERTKDGVAVTFTVDGKQQKLEADKVLIAVGRAPRTEERRNREDEGRSRAWLREDRRIHAYRRARHLRHRRYRHGLSATRARRCDGRHRRGHAHRWQAGKENQQAAHSQRDLLSS